MKVTGKSLSPNYLEGDYLLVLRIPFFWHRLKAGDFVVFHHPVYGVMVKKLESSSNNGAELFVIGSHPESTDSRQFGPIPARWVIGKVIAHIPRSTQKQ